MGGDAKSPQHTVVHPMYVSYSCIPTSTTMSPKNTTNNTLEVNKKPKIAFNNTNFNSLSSPLYNTSSNNRKPMSSFNNDPRPNIRYTELSTEQLVNFYVDEGNAENWTVNPMQTFDTSSNSNNNNRNRDDNVRDTLAVQNEGYLIQEPGSYSRRVYQSPIDQAQNDSMRSLDQSSIYHNQSSDFIVNRHVDNDNIPYITRSPQLNRSTPRRRNERSHINCYDKIRDPPPGYVVTNYSTIQRAKSQDRIALRKQSLTKNKSRPRSYCSNGN